VIHKVLECRSAATDAPKPSHVTCFHSNNSITALSQTITVTHLLEAKQLHTHIVGVFCSVQFRLQEPALLKLAQQLAAGPPTSLLHGWQQPPAALFLNKQDKLQPHIRDVALQQLGQQLGGIAQFDAVFQGAAMRGEGVDELREYFISKVSCPSINHTCL
jgi:hypothetical protein